MIIVGAKGFANEVLEVMRKNEKLDQLAFYDDLHNYPLGVLHGRFPILSNENDVKSHFSQVGNAFVLGLGNPTLRRKMYDKFTAWGGQVQSTISPNAKIGQYDVEIGNGSNIFDQAIISTNVHLGLGAIVYYNTVITHDVIIGDFVDLSPGAVILGRARLGDYCQVGSHATILPDVTLGKNVIVAAGAVVTEDVPDNCMVAGIPATVKKELQPLDF